MWAKLRGGTLLDPKPESDVGHHCWIKENSNLRDIVGNDIFTVQRRALVDTSEVSFIEALDTENECTLLSGCRPPSTTALTFYSNLQCFKKKDDWGVVPRSHLTPKNSEVVCTYSSVQGKFYLRNYDWREDTAEAECTTQGMISVNYGRVFMHSNVWWKRGCNPFPMLAMLSVGTSCRKGIDQICWKIRCHELGSHSKKKQCNVTEGSSR